ncbi:hypothetical protein AUK11_03335 [bacterium CG2_30_37_16]|nr:MAG: hypothetical protein AUK11_03335 [bacterium CG2_30_37_16]PIP30348.1 MAG: hypothetical protein COX25_05175 [bacterium (Candidatus Howlettbacteria) CG23_combo_of_CG06-09_8_20_14_all_37_9]
MESVLSLVENSFLILYNSLMLKIAVGTTSKSKIKCLNEVLEEISLGAVFYPTNVESGVSSQPKKRNQKRLFNWSLQKGMIKRV